MQARRLSPQYKIDILKIISGGQTGVDRAALDVALKRSNIESSVAVGVRTGASMNPAKFRIVIH